MKIVCDRVRLQEALGVIGAAVPNQPTTPIASNVLVRASEDGLKLQSTDLSIFAQVNVLELKEVVSGEALIPVSRLIGLVREMTEEKVLIERDPEGYTVQISSGNDNFSIMGHDPGDFPQVPEATTSAPLELESDSVKTALRSVSFAASRDESRQQLQGVAFIVEGKKAHFMASDGKRLAEKK